MKIQFYQKNIKKYMTAPIHTFPTKDIQRCSTPENGFMKLKTINTAITAKNASGTAMESLGTRQRTHDHTR